MQDDESGAAGIRGTFGDRSLITSEAQAGLVGQGTLAVTDEGLRVSARWLPSQRRVLTMFGAFVGAGVGCVAALGAGPLASAGAVLLPLGVAAGVWRRWCREVAWERTVPWSEVSQPSVSEGALMFRLEAPAKGMVQFRVPGYGVRELRPIAQAIKARLNRS